MVSTSPPIGNSFNDFRRFDLRLDAPVRSVLTIELVAVVGTSVLVILVFNSGVSSCPDLGGGISSMGSPSSLPDESESSSLVSLFWTTISRFAAVVDSLRKEDDRRGACLCCDSATTGATMCGTILLVVILNTSLAS